MRWYANYFGAVEWMQATRTSFAAGVLTMMVATPLGTLAAYGLFARGCARQLAAARVLLHAAHRSGDPDRASASSTPMPSSSSTTR